MIAGGKMGEAAAIGVRSHAKDRGRRDSSPGVRIIVTGSRSHCDVQLVERELDKLHRRASINVIIHGCCGAQAGAIEHWARLNGLSVVRYSPNWERFGHRGESLRNSFMLEDSRPDLVVAFPGGHGTADLVLRARTVGIAVIEIRSVHEKGSDGAGNHGAAADGARRTIAGVAEKESRDEART
jgi:hypothetical protein